MTQTIVQKTFDAERALYHLTDALVQNCKFEGDADGESALKECRSVTVRDCAFSLRYPLWHAEDFTVQNCTFSATARAPIWYAKRGKLQNCRIDGIKILRECDTIALENCVAHSPELGWRCNALSFADTEVESEYFLFESRNIKADKLRMRGKYSFQYIENAEIVNADLDTKDAFWHCKNVTVKNSHVKGEYLGWYSDGLTLENCVIEGTQPLCYCKNLTLIDCRMQGCDLAFEYSDVSATLNGHIDSIKNPKSGKIVVDSVGEIVRGDEVMPCSATVEVRKTR